MEVARRAQNRHHRVFRNDVRVADLDRLRSELLAELAGLVLDVVHDLDRGLAHHVLNCDIVTKHVEDLLLDLADLEARHVLRDLLRAAVLLPPLPVFIVLDKEGHSPP